MRRDTRHRSLLIEPLQRLLRGLRELVTLGRREPPQLRQPVGDHEICPPASRAERLRQSLAGSPTGRFMLRAMRHEEGDRNHE